MRMFAVTVVWAWAVTVRSRCVPPVVRFIKRSVHMPQAATPSKRR
jgi:hypothetical protein